MMDDATQKKVSSRLKRIAGQVDGIHRMIENERYCVDVLLQIAAVRSALAKVGEVMLASHVETCVTEAFTRGKKNEREQKIEELLRVFARFR